MVSIKSSILDQFGDALSAGAGQVLFRLEGTNMLLLFGLKTVLRPLRGRTATCQTCGLVVHHYLEERASKFTLFFIPVFTMSRSYRITCSNCGQVSAISARKKKALAR